MKKTTALIAAGLLSASLPAFAQGVQPNQAKPGPATLPPQINSQQMYQGTGVSLGTGPMSALPPGKIAAGQAQIAGVAPPALPSSTDLMNPQLAGQVSADIYSFMALFQKLAQDMRQTAREQRSSAMETQVAALQDAAEKMKQAAAANMAQAQITGAMAIASGAMQIAGGAAQAGQMKPGAQAAMKPGAQAGTKPGAQGISGIGQMQAPTKALTPQEKQQAIGAMANAQQAFSANMVAAEVDKKKVEVAQTQAQAQMADSQQAQAQQQMMLQMMDVIRDIQQKLQAIQQSQAATAQAIIRN